MKAEVGREEGKDRESRALLIPKLIHPHSMLTVNAGVVYRIARKFRGVKFSWKLIRLSFCVFIFTDSNPIAIINDVNIVSWIKIFAGEDKSAKILHHKTF